MGSHVTLHLGDALRLKPRNVATEDPLYGARCTQRPLQHHRPARCMDDACAEDAIQRFLLLPHLFFDSQLKQHMPDVELVCYCEDHSSCSWLSFLLAESWQLTPHQPPPHTSLQQLHCSPNASLGKQQSQAARHSAPDSYQSPSAPLRLEANEVTSVHRLHGHNPLLVRGEPLHLDPCAEDSLHGFSCSPLKFSTPIAQPKATSLHGGRQKNHASPESPRRAGTIA
mmetsp:Transcript_45494/g.108176  ORF Transcript_45494/g.108176 Transcript_45494/m.108176 type:complete len:226 (-) Transcript_45494:1294-1971(-)